MPRPTSQRGDFTGQERERLAREKADELVERQKEIGLVNQVDIVVEEEGVFDPSSGALLEVSDQGRQRIGQINEPVMVDEDEIFDPSQPQPPKPPPPTQVTETQQVPKLTRPNALQVEDLGAEPMVVDQEWRVIRVNTDIEQMTYGAGNDLTFLRGRRYRVPRDLYDWLESRGVVYH
jgi:hypothetical protein